MLKNRIFILLIAVLSSYLVLCQNPNFDFKLASKKYTTDDYNAMPQIFDITQDLRGVMYFANQNGVIEYDGSKWRNISLYPESEINAIKVDNNGVVYAGGFEEFGFLERIDSGDTKFKSFKELIPDSIYFKRIFNIAINSKNEVLFQSQKHLFLYTDGEIKIESAKGDNIFHEAFLFKDEFYVRVVNKGLYKYNNGVFDLTNYGNFFSDKNIMCLAEINNKNIVVTDQTAYQTSGGNSPEEIKLDGIENLALYKSITINNNYLSVGTFGNGVFLYDDQLKLKYVIDQKSGLSDGVIQCQFLDMEGNLWIGTNNGILKVLVNTPLTISNLKDNEISTVEGIIEYNDNLFFSTLDGVYYVNKNNFQSGFKVLEGINVDCFGFMTYSTEKEEYLLIAGVDNIYSLDSKGKLEVVADCSPYRMMVDFSDSTRIIICNYKGLSSIKWNGTTFIDEGFVDGFQEDVYNFEYDKNGDLFIGSKKKGLYKTTYRIFSNHNEPISNISEEFLEDKSSHAFVTKIDNKIFIGTDEGLFQKNNGTFEKTNLGDLKHEKYGIHRIQQFKNGDVWMVTYNDKNIFSYEVGYAKKENNYYKWYSEDFKNYSDELIHAVYVDKSGTTWLGGVKNIFRYDKTLSETKTAIHNTLIRKVSWGNQLIFNGNYPLSPDSSFSEVAEKPASLSFSNNRIEFQFTATSLQNESKNIFSYILEGQDEKWSPWSNDVKCDYTNLREGKYTFKVMSKNLYGLKGKSTQFSFVILAPWYRTKVAYLCYVLLVVLLIYVSIKLATLRINKQKDHLEKVVKARTKEISIQKEKVQELYNDVTDSIKYAKRLQDSILPTNEKIKSLFPKSFVYFKPKDIVSGDFYWVNQSENELLIAAVDCTGHGVPGAFMSLVGASGLNASVRDNKNTRPSLIMDDLNSFAHNALNKNLEENKINDGMDMALISIEKNKEKLKFAGAYNPLYIVRNNELAVYKGDRFAIGSYKPGEKQFQDNEIVLEKNDMVYMFSDGFVDQFGGPKEKKFMSKNFRQLLIDIHQKPVAKQRDVLNEKFIGWKGNLEQMDDVLVIGIRI